MKSGLSQGEGGGSVPHLREQVVGLTGKGVVATARLVTVPC